MHAQDASIFNLKSDSVQEYLYIDGNINFHIHKVEVIAGDDGYKETDMIEVISKNFRLVAKRNIEEHNQKSKLRLRDEPAVRIHLESEDSQKYVITIGHHKGSVMVFTEKN